MFKSKNKNNKRGFTLIELLVVISIISLLSSVIFASLNSARMKARDARRREDIHNLVAAISMYYNENGTWPMSTNTTSGDWPTVFKTQMAPYISSLPIDPVPSRNTSYPYVSTVLSWIPTSDPCYNHYVVYVYLEGPIASGESNCGATGGVLMKDVGI